MQQDIPRTALLHATTRALSEAPVAALLGARQVGKTTLARHIAANRPEPTVLFDLERADVREALSRAPERMLGNRRGLVILDEVQRVPAIFEALRPICDAPDRKAVFLLLGSTSWDLVRGISETLAERIQFVDVAGFSLDEVRPEQQNRLWMRGGFVRSYGYRRFPEAQAEYLRLEAEHEGEPGFQACLVSADSAKALRRAYPNYFLDISAFADSLNLFLGRQIFVRGATESDTP